VLPSTSSDRSVKSFVAMVFSSWMLFEFDFPVQAHVSPAALPDLTLTRVGVISPSLQTCFSYGRRPWSPYSRHTRFVR
jgi:hypothetical protein